MGLQIRFTKRDIEALAPAAAGKREYYEDPRIPYLRLAVTDSGAKSWVVQRRIQGKVTRITLGRFPDLTPENARTHAERVAGDIAHGRNPQNEKREARAKRLTLAEAFEEMLEVRRLKPATVKTYRQVMSAALGDWMPRPMTNITKDAVADRHAKLTKESGGPYADSAMRTLRAVWNFAGGQYETADGESMMPPNPVLRLSKTKAWHRNRPRKTYIAEHQLEPWFAAVQELRSHPWDSAAKTVGDYLALLVLTGMRRSEGASLAWDQVDLRSRALVLHDTKNREDHTLPLSDFVVELLTERSQRAARGAQYVFPSVGRAGYLQEPRVQIRRVIAASGVPFSLHDLRRTFITSAERLDLPAYVLSRLANHQLGHPVTRDYIVNDIERLRGPMQKITDYLLSASNVRRRAPAVMSLSVASRGVPQS